MKIIMPTLGMTMQEGFVTEWYKKDGDPIEKGEKMYGVASEKIEMDIKAPATGILKISAPADLDNPIKCGDEIGEIIED